MANKFTNEMFFEKNGFNENGIGYAIAGRTFDIKDDLKAMKAKFNGYAKCWIIPEFIEGVNIKSIKIYADDLYEKRNGVFDYRLPKFDSLYRLAAQVKEIADKIEESENIWNPSRFQGQIGDKITVNVIEAKYITSYAGSFGSTNIYQFLDANKNIYIWRTCKDLATERVKEITGTIAYHTDYKGVEQTVMSRCKVKYA